MSRKLDKSDLERLFKKYYAPLCQYCIRFVHDNWLAEEIVQDRFMHLWECRDSLELTDSFESFLYKAVRNKAIDHLRSRAAKFSHMLEEELPEIPDQGNPLSDMEYCELKKEITHIIESLPEKCRIIFTLKIFGEMSNQEIASELNISIKTVLNQLTKAKNMVRAAVSKKNLGIQYQFGKSKSPGKTE